MLKRKANQPIEHVIFIEVAFTRTLPVCGGTAIFVYEVRVLSQLAFYSLKRLVT